MIRILCTFLFCCVISNVFSQSTIAKLKFESAEEAYSQGNYQVALTKLNESESLFGKSNPIISHLRILTLDKLIREQSGSDSKSIEYLALLTKESDYYMANFSTLANTEDKTREVYKVQETYEKSINNLRKELVIETVTSAYKGNIEAIYKLGRIYEERDITRSALDWYLIAAEKGHVPSMAKVGGDLNIDLKYYEERGFNKESANALALQYLPKAIESGDVRAMYWMGRRLSYGEGVTKQTAKGIELLSKAAEKGDKDAYLMLGDLYQNGDKDLSIDYTKSLDCFKKSAELGKDDACGRIASLYEKGNGIPQDYFKAMEWYQKGTIMNPKNADLYFSIGDLYKSGKGVDKSYSNALEYYKKGAEANEMFVSVFDKEAGVIYYQGGFGVTQDFQKALDCFIRSKFFAESLFYLGVMHENGQGIPQSYTMAMDWYVKAANKDHAEAMRGIARLYEKGLGVKKDKVLAAEWNNKAIAASNNKESK